MSDQSTRNTPTPNVSRRWYERIPFAAGAVELANRQLDAEVRSYAERVPAAGEEAGPSSDADLLASLNDAAGQTNTIFVIYVSLLAYALLALARVKDADFYGYVGTIKLPVLDVEVSPGVFFIVTPLIVVGVTWYLHVYLGQVKRLWRRLKLRARQQGREIDPDRASAWLGALSEQRGPVGRMVRVVFAAFVYALPPLTVGLYSARLIHFRSSIHNWMNLGAPPSWTLVGILALVAAVFSLGWFVSRRALDQRLGIAPPAPARIRVGRALVAGLLLVVAGGMAAQRWWLPLWEVGATLPRARISTPKTEGETSPVGATLTSVDLEWANLEGAYLEDAKMYCGTFRFARLRRANLHGAIVGGLCSSTNEGADLRKADLSEADLTEAFLEHVRMNGADLARAELDRAKASDAVLREVNGSASEWCGAHLNRADFTAAVLEDAHFEGADLSGAVLRGANLRGAHLDIAKLEGAHLEGADLSRAYLVGADLTGANLEGAKLDGADLTAATLRGTFLRGATFADARIEGADLTDATLEAANFGWNKNDRVCWLHGAPPHPPLRFSPARYDTEEEECLVARCELLADSRNLSDKVGSLTNEGAAGESPTYLEKCMMERTYDSVKLNAVDSEGMEVHFDPKDIAVTVKGPVRDLARFDGHTLRVTVSMRTEVSGLVGRVKLQPLLVTPKKETAPGTKPLTVPLLTSMVEMLPTHDVSVVGFSKLAGTPPKLEPLATVSVGLKAHAVRPPPIPASPVTPHRPTGGGQQ